MKGLEIKYYGSKSELYIHEEFYIIAIDNRQHKLKQEWDLRKLLEKYYDIKQYNERIRNKKLKRLLYFCHDCEKLQRCLR